MEKTHNIINEVSTFKNSVKIENSFYIKYGSFYRFEKKYVNDIDINLIIKTNKLYYIDIINILKKINNNDKVLMLNIYCGYDDYYYNDIYEISYFEKLLNKKIITQKQFDDIDILLKTEKDHSIIKKYIDPILELKWTFDDVNNGYLEFNNKRYYFEKILDGFIWFDIIYQFDKPIQMEFIIQSITNFKSHKPQTLYSGCSLAKNEYKLHNYYNFIKRIKSCYAVNMKKLKHTLSDEQIKYIESNLSYLMDITKSTEEYTSKYHLKLAQYKLDKNNEKILEINNIFNDKFKEFAEKYYKEGIDIKLIY